MVATTADALSLDGLKALYTAPKEALESFLGLAASSNVTLFALSSKKATQLMTCVWNGQYDQHESGGGDDAAHAIELSPVLDGEESVRTYPSFPHAPVLVAASSCERVMLRWKNFEDATWPVQRYVLQRYPDHKHRNAWTTLLETNDTTDVYPDAHVRAGKLYSYRVQAISSDNVSSAYAFDQVAVRTGSCNGGLFGALLPSQFPSWSMFSNWSCEAVRTLCLLVLCFLTVYGLMRASVKRMQGTHSRNYRLKRIHKSAAEGLSHKSAAAATGGGNGANMQSSKLTHRSSSDSSSTSPPSESMDPNLSQRSMGSLSSVATRESLSSAAADLSMRESSSFMLPARDRSGSLEKASACQNCQKRFGIFRRRHMCDICHAVTLCRKCGYQAPVNFARGSLISGLDESFADTPPGGAGATRRSSLGRESLLLTEGQRKVKIKTICRGCCEEVYRYSTAVRPSVFGPGGQ